ncbi:MAG: Hsp20/alpha crystallin family protein [Deltaproteobacteria bacterium]|nr:Hsp20/alpha crystallin family protein [Deltaproteobacteria bacterium]
MVIDFSTYYDLPQNIERLFEEFARPLSISQRRSSYPPVNIAEDEKTIYVSAEIPGMNIEDIELTLTEGSLVLKGTRKPEQGSYYRQERPTGNFQRIVSLNVPINSDGVQASMKNGVLNVELPKAEEALPKKISIETA